MVYVKILNKTLEYDNGVSTVEQLWEQIVRQVEETGYLFSHLIIDGEEIFDDYQIFIIDNWDRIETIDVVVKTLKDMIYGIFISIDEYLTRALPEIKIIVDEFYQGPTKTTWHKFEEMLLGLEWINQSMYSIENNKNLSVTWGKYIIFIQELQGKLTELQEALEHGDVVLIGDIIAYELGSVLNSLHNEVKNTIHNEVTSYDAN